MQNYVIFGAGTYGVWLKRFLDNHVLQIQKDYSVIYFVDNLKPKGSYIEGVEIISPYDLKYIDTPYEVLISSATILDEAMLQLKSLNIHVPVHFVPPYAYRFQSDEAEGMPVFIEMDIFKPRLPYVECAIVKHCNLKCKGCSAFANSHPEEFAKIDVFEKDMKRLKELYCGIKYFKLFGGEPLLHPQLKDFIRVARKYFPDSVLVIHSNGLLVPKLADDLLTYMNKMDVEFKFTLYPVTGTIKARIERKLEKANIRYLFTEPVYNFRKGIRIAGDYNPNDIYRHCCKCINLIEGTLSCGLGFGIDKIEKEFGLKICDNKYERCVNIHTTKMDGWAINEFLDKPAEICSYCAFMDYSRKDHGEQYYYKWQGDYTELRMEDYVIIGKD